MGATLRQASRLLQKRIAAHAAAKRARLPSDPIQRRAAEVAMTTEGHALRRQAAVIDQQVRSFNRRADTEGLPKIKG
ncbi:MAG TPA: hypothetical protein VIL86_07180 [Tepidisphaeraceae bacterium]